MSYTKKTCEDCGWRDVQPKMVQVNRQSVSGSSKQKATFSTYFFGASGNKTAEKAVHRSLTGAGTREYKRNRKAWLCKSCARKSSPWALKNILKRVFKLVLKTSIICAILLFIVALGL